MAYLMPALAWAQEMHRPAIHFSPKKGWMNDPNGMVYLNGTYHLFFQHNPDSTVWGPMHWGHAVSKDLVHWKELPIALYPDSLGTIFSGSAVVDFNNTAGFGKQAMVTIYTNHNHRLEAAGSDKFQNQSIAYSLDEGKTWTKYNGNPVLSNPGIRDFRDPKVSWYEAGKKWIMTLATKDRITFYSSPDLKHWKEESQFGKDLGAHGGVWECPDLFPLNDNGREIWVLIVNINPGGPNGGSGTQYFTGSFDGHSFKADHTGTKWLDYGPDEYAGVTWSNTPGRRIFLGWMSNWDYANVVPTQNWRSATSIARELKLVKTSDGYLVASQPVREFNKVKTSTGNYHIKATKGKLALSLSRAASFTVTLSNDVGEQTVIGYDHQKREYFIDRRLSGDTAFHNGFAARYTVPRFTHSAVLDLTLVIDVSSVELFADGGRSVMTAIFFPHKDYTDLNISRNVPVKKISYEEFE
ncbi:glycoside hydrolase family 32 protein [Chitinophaga varians]|nr:glycoside hydrolase family 32 protein [Chitinophaga varians]